MHDLTAASLYGNYNGIDIIIPHAWFPVTAAYKKQMKIIFLCLVGKIMVGWICATVQRSIMQI